MNAANFREHLRRNGWLLGALAVCIAACLLLGVSQDTANDSEARISRVLSSLAGAGHTEVALYYDQQAVPCGALVLAEGAGDIAVRLQLTNAVSTLLGLDPQAVAVYPLQGGSP